MKYYLYNSLANNGITPELKEGIQPIDAVGLNYQEFFDGLAAEDEVVLIGGDGTLNYFINAVDTDKISNNVYLLGAGTGNDFFNDIERKAGEEVLINEYIKNLPTVYVNGLEKKFINGIGYGIDGYACEVADQIKAKTPNKEINYSAIVIKGILGKFDSHHATVTVDGVTNEYDDVWIAATMKGRYYGGGLKITPGQDRAKKTVSSVVYMSKSRIKGLMNFPKIPKGEHVALTQYVKIYEGSEITVSFKRPCALQIDGETVLNVTTYTVKA